MPTIEIYLEDLFNLIGERISLEELDDLLDYAKCEIEDIKNNLIKVESKDTNRPDLWSVEGISRVIRNVLGKSKSYYIPDVKKSDEYKVYVDESLKSCRPYIGCLVVKNLNIDEYSLSSFIQQQEKLAKSLGKNRRKIAIGFYDLDKIKFPVYYTVGDSKDRMIPLYFSEEMTLEEILEKTPQGKEYGNIVREYGIFPVLKDSNGKIFGFLPIVNSDDVGRITTKTKNIFIDVSGTDLSTISLAINILAYNLYDRGGEIYSVSVIYPDGNVISYPKFEEKDLIISKEKVSKVIGENFNDYKLIDLLETAGYKVNKVGEKDINVSYPPYRRDIFSELDVVEDIAIFYGYNNFECVFPRFYSRGGLRQDTKFYEVIRDIMIGMGFLEVRNPILSSYDIQTMGGVRNYITKNLIKLKNFVSKNYDVVRDSIYPQLIKIVSDNKKCNLPFLLFEIGRVAFLKDEEVREEDRLSILVCNKEISFSNLKSILKTLFYNIRIESFSLDKSNLNDFIEGRQAYVLVNGNSVGIIGEIHPKVCEFFNLKFPFGVIELNISKIQILKTVDII